MGSVYPIPVLHAPYRTCKTERFSPMNLLDEVYDKNSWNFLNGSENHFTKLSQEILRGNFCWLCQSWSTSNSIFINLTK